MRIQRLAVLTVTLAAMAAPGYGSTASDLRSALIRSAGHQADFTQEFTAKGFSKPRVEKGSVVIGELPNMRWNYTTPEIKTFVFDGETSWFWAKDDNQVMIHQVGADEKESLPFVFLTDTDWLQRNYSISEKKGSRSTIVSLQPKKKGLVTAIEIEIDRTGRLETMSWVDDAGNHTKFLLTNYRPVKTNASSFVFTPPAGASIVRN